MACQAPFSKNKNGRETLEVGTVVGAVFVALINSLVLAGAVVGIDIATSQPQ
jgi:ubiquinone/menaquinone biosynthesis C-methylase UbiE